MQTYFKITLTSLKYILRNIRFQGFAFDKCTLFRALVELDGWPSSMEIGNINCSPSQAKIGPRSHSSSSESRSKYSENLSNPPTEVDRHKETDDDKTAKETPHENMKESGVSGLPNLSPTQHDDGGNIASAGFPPTGEASSDEEDSITLPDYSSSPCNRDGQ